MAELNNIIFPLLMVLVGYGISKYLIGSLNKIKSNLLIDNQFTKPQAFHQKPTYRIGGVIIFLLLILVFLYLYFFKNLLYIEYMTFGVLFFTIGFLDDLKINLVPKFRLGLMICSLLFLIIFNDLYLKNVGLEFLDYLLVIDIFALIFMILCFLFIINGSNLIDGFNGLLGIHALIIFTILFFINFTNENTYLMYILFYCILITFVFLKFNFPKSQIFLGDSGAYLLGVLIAISTIKTSIANPSISPFFFCALLFYLFFEVFFSFFRKIFVAQRSPLFPDSKHLHMKLYNLLLKEKRSKINSNYYVSIYVNITYFVLLIPVLVFSDQGLFCRYYFIFLLSLYIIIYKKLDNFKKVF